MPRPGFTSDRLLPILRLLLLFAAIATYLLSPEDVVWRAISAKPQARLLEHLAFGCAAALLGIAFLLKMQASVVARPSSLAVVVSNLLEAVGIGSLLPLPGFLLLVAGEAALSLLPGPARRKSQPSGSTSAEGRPVRDALVVHAGLCCAFLAMIAFSITLNDKLADVLFALAGVVSLLVMVMVMVRSRSA